jgi:hypothetical protein
MKTEWVIRDPFIVKVCIVFFKIHSITWASQRPRPGDRGSMAEN